MFDSLLTWITSVDDAVAVAVNGHAGRSPEFDALVVWAISAPLVKFGIPIAVLFAFWVSRGADRIARARVASTLCATFVGLFVARALALSLPFRDRPLNRPELGLSVPPELIVDMRSWSAFPSDHAVMALTLAVGIWMLSRRLGVLAVVHAVVFICLPRLFMGFHHLSDLAVGAVIGVAIAVLFDRPVIRDAVGRVVDAAFVRAPAAASAMALLLLTEMSMMFIDLRAVAHPLFAQLRHWVN